MHARLAARRAPHLAREVSAQLAASLGLVIAVASVSIASIAYLFTTSWATALHAGALTCIAALLLSVQAAQRRQTAVLQGQMEELRRLLHVAEAVLDADDLDSPDDMDEVTVARAPRLEREPSTSTSLGSRLRRFGRRLRR